MALCNKWWILCAVSLSCVTRFGSCRRHREDADATVPQPESFIFNELCALRDETGPCKASKERFFFNVDTGRCEQFEYGGCNGNANNFETLEACEETCIVSDDKNPCHLPAIAGPCRGLMLRYFFDNETQQCQHFFYGGCFGNANNFRTMAQCQAKCPNPAKSTKAPQVPTPSGKRFVAVQPSAMTAELTVSEPLVQTNYTSQDPKELTPALRCFNPVDRGTCQGAERRFAYNPKTRRCHVFSYSGCGGNDNNFTKRRDCIFKCIGGRKAHGKKLIRIRKKNLDNISQRPV